MLDSPAQLQSLCLNALCCSRQFFREALRCLNQNQNQLETYLPGTIAESLLEALSVYGNLSDDILELFNSHLTSLKRVSAKNSHILTIKGLKTFRQHKIVSIDLANLIKISVNDLIACLSEWTVQNLSVLNVANSTFASNGKFSVIVVLSKLRNLKSLDVSNTELTTHGLGIIVEDLQLLECLNISKTKISDITPLRKCKHRLTSLSMYNLKQDRKNDFVSVIWTLRHLRVLDVSEDISNPLESLTSSRSSSIRLFDVPKCLPDLVSIDVSGKDGFTPEELKNFLVEHPNLQFLGLVYSDLSSEDMFINPYNQNYNPDLMVSGSANDNQILEALRRYSLRQNYVQKLLYVLYNHTQAFIEPRVDIIELVISVMKLHSRSLVIQMSGTACLYNLSKNTLGPKIHPRWFQDIVAVTLIAMGNFPKHQQLQKNALLTLCSDRILQDIAFERYKCAKLVMESLVAFEDLSMNKMAVAICSILAAKIATGEIASLGAEPHYMGRLLNILIEQIEEHEDAVFVDTTMVKFTLSALWNLTDESPKTCTVFLELGGLDLMLKLLLMFIGESSIETKVLGLMNNIVEVENLRPDVLHNGFISAICHLLQSSQIDVAYFSAGIIAHLCCDNSSTWSKLELTKKKLLNDLSNVVTSWTMPENEMVSYRSFKPFYPLLDAEHHEIQLWALWAIHHVCSKNSKRYCPMLAEENGIAKIKQILNGSSSHHLIVMHSTEILAIVEQEN